MQLRSFRTAKVCCLFPTACLIECPHYNVKGTAGKHHGIKRCHKFQTREEESGEYVFEEAPCDGGFIQCINTKM